MATHNILIPLDGSTWSARIVSHVCRLFDPTHAAFTLLRVEPVPQAVVTVPPLMIQVGGMLLPDYESANEIERLQHPIYADQVEHNVRAALADELDIEARDLRAAGYQVTVAVRFGDPAREIKAVAKQLNVDLIAMATHGRSGLGELALGSVAADVLRHAAVPVLLVRPVI